MLPDPENIRLSRMVGIICWWELICLFHWNAIGISRPGFFSSSDAFDTYILDSSNVSFIHANITSKELKSHADIMFPCVRVHTNMLSKNWHREHISHQPIVVSIAHENLRKKEKNHICAWGGCQKLQLHQKMWTRTKFKKNTKHTKLSYFWPAKKGIRKVI